MGYVATLSIAGVGRHTAPPAPVQWSESWSPLFVCPQGDYLYSRTFGHSLCLPPCGEAVGRCLQLTGNPHGEMVWTSAVHRLCLIW